MAALTRVAGLAKNSRNRMNDVYNDRRLDDFRPMSLEKLTLPCVDRGEGVRRWHRWSYRPGRPLYDRLVVLLSRKLLCDFMCRTEFTITRQ